MLAHLCCCLPKGTTEPTTVDLDKIITDWAWTDYMTRCGSIRSKFLRRKDYDITYPDEHLEITQTDPILKTRKTLAERSKTSSPVSYINNSDKTELHTFKYLDNKTLTTQVVITKGLSIGIKGAFSVGLPEGFGTPSFFLERTSQMTESKTETQEKSISSEVAVDITIKPKERYDVKVLTEETVTHTPFEVILKVSLPFRTLPISIQKKTDKKVVYDTRIDDTSLIFQDVPDVVQPTNIPDERDPRLRVLANIDDLRNRLTHETKFKVTGVLKERHFATRLISSNPERHTVV